MFKPGTDWNPKQTLLKEYLKSKDKFTEAINLCLDMHKMIHLSPVSSTTEITLADEVWDGLTDEDFEVMPTSKDVTIAWNIWHITRIEDLTINILVKGWQQVLDETWLDKLQVTVKDTGNAMTDDEIIKLSKSINKQELKNYRNAVGKQTQQILSALTAEDLKRKITSDRLERIRLEGGVTNHPDSIWLLDFWGKKDVSGILQMPITRHQIVHLNDSLKLKAKIMKLDLKKQINT
ncbi:DinB family protein [Anaerocolumna sedimenticola]|uniref:DinB family protein n=1 Tax=Anaerocolumna sedimenticola TaxID=2696063 RepID=A0A6P1TJ02_9FIRM|nr:DinB family protein [Anaerocolumna sedimenticola]QHQ61180.1 DinB family protein [Anaerocolumna sedimenticola]